MISMFLILSVTLYFRPRGASEHRQKPRCHRVSAPPREDDAARPSAMARTGTPSIHMRVPWAALRSPLIDQEPPRSRPGAAQETT